MKTMSQVSQVSNKSEKNIAYYVSKIVQLQRKNDIEDVKRYALFPILDEKGHEFYQKQELTHWSASEMEFVKDVPHYNAATPQVRKMVDTTLSFFLSGDGLVSDNIVYRFLMECKTYEEKSMFISQLHIELIHAESYGLAAFTFKRDAKAMAELIESAQNTTCVKKKMAFMEKWMLADRPRYQRLVSFSLAEGVFFCTLFAVIFWFRSKGWFPNFVFANELIAYDESLHRDWGAHLFGVEMIESFEKDNRGKGSVDEFTQLYYSEILEIVEEALTIEDEFVDYILPESVNDLNAKDLKQYARLITDNLLVQLGFAPKFNVKNPFTWMNDISMEQKGNFYEVRIASYKKRSLGDILNWKKRAGLVEEKVNAYTDPQDIEF